MSSGAEEFISDEMKFFVLGQKLFLFLSAFFDGALELIAFLSCL
jgi:hypothetical protein